MRYYTPKGHAIQAHGIKPDVVVEAAYVADKSFGVVRESDLENHLPAEGTHQEQAPAAGPSSGDGGAPETHLGVAREIPDDPTGGPDFALSIGYQILRGVLSH
jgi:carboxyl-terminal processing protease